MTHLLKLTAVSFKKELAIVFGIMAGILALPCIAVASLTNVSALVPGADGTTSAGTLFTDNSIPEDTYDYGNCTYWTAFRRIQIGDPVPNTWGNAATWAVRALLDGYKVDHTPSFGAIMQTPDAAGGLGHVAFVESTNPKDGTWTISEMNVLGWDITDTHTYPAKAAASYSFIHDREMP